MMTLSKLFKISKNTKGLVANTTKLILFGGYNERIW